MFWLAYSCAFCSDVTSEDSEITFNIYDRAASDSGFLGMVQVKPVLTSDHTVDQWYKCVHSFLCVSLSTHSFRSLHARCS